MLDISLLAPELATIVASINFLLVAWNFRSKPWNFKFWIILSMFFWIPWAGATIILRLASTQNIALRFLQISYVSSYVCFYALFRFHNMLSTRGDSKFLSFFMAVFMGVNIALGLNPDFLNVTKTSGGLYYTDHFSSQLFLLHVSFTLILGYLVYRALKEIDALSIFFSSSGRKSPIQMFFGLALIFIDGGLLVFFFSSGGGTDATPFLIFSILITTFLGITYGIRPMSKILSPQRLWTFFVISKSGLPIYEYHFSDQENIGELALVAGAMNASNVTLMAYLGSEEPLQEVELDDRVIIISSYEKTLFCLVADKSTLQLQIVHNEVVKQIIEDPLFNIDNNGFTRLDDVKFINSYVVNAFSTSSGVVN